jgi:hypothetical protein
MYAYQVDMNPVTQPLLKAAPTPNLIGMAEAPPSFAKHNAYP